MKFGLFFSSQPCIICFQRVTLPTVEDRFENLKVEAECYVGGRALPTLSNAATNAVDVNLIAFSSL